MMFSRLSRQLSPAMLFIGFFIAVVFCNRANANQEDMKQPAHEVKALNTKADFPHVTTADTVGMVVEHPAFKGSRNGLLPWDSRTGQLDVRLSNVRALLPYHSHVNPEIVVDALNFMIDQAGVGQTIFYDFYTEHEKNLDPAKDNTGLFFIKGQPGAPFAVICPGGGFAYVGSFHEGFPHAVALSRKGLNAFVIRYRTGNGMQASEDLAAAVSFIFNNAESLEVNTAGYSLWGSSAGARMVGDIALNGVALYGASNIPKPGTLVIAYTGQSTYSSDFPPTFIIVSEDDPIASAATVDRRVNNLKSAGVKVEYHRFKHASHGFGVGTGTDAEGWVNDAVRFWLENLPKR